MSCYLCSSSFYVGEKLITIFPGSGSKGKGNVVGIELSEKRRPGEPVRPFDGICSVVNWKDVQGAQAFFNLTDKEMFVFEYRIRAALDAIDMLHVLGGDEE